MHWLVVSLLSLSIGRKAFHANRSTANVKASACTRLLHNKTFKEAWYILFVCLGQAEGAKKRPREEGASSGESRRAEAVDAKQAKMACTGTFSIFVLPQGAPDGYFAVPNLQEQHIAVTMASTACSLYTLLNDKSWCQSPPYCVSSSIQSTGLLLTLRIVPRTNCPRIAAPQSSKSPDARSSRIADYANSRVTPSL